MLRTRLGRWSPLWRGEVVAIVDAIILCLATGVLAFLFLGLRFPSSASLVILDGGVVLGPDWRSAEVRGEHVGVGRVVRTLDRGRAVLTFFDGSTVTLESDTEVVIEELANGNAAPLRVALRQTEGRTWHALGPSGRSSYVVSVPTGRLESRGGSFEVEVRPDGSAVVRTAEGAVHVATERGSAAVPEGKTAAVRAESSPAVFDSVPSSRALVVRFAATGDALVVDPEGRATGAHDGIPVRYSPRSSVAVTPEGVTVTLPEPSAGRFRWVARSRATDVTAVLELRAGDTLAGRVEQSRPTGKGAARGAFEVSPSSVNAINDESPLPLRLGTIPPPPALPPLPFLTGRLPN